MKGHHGPIKPIIVTSPDGTETEFKSGSEAARELGIAQSDISKMCRGKAHMDHIKGYKVRFKDVAKPGVG